MSAASRRPFALSAHVVCCRRAYFSLPPTLQNLRIENRLLRRENLSGDECKLARIRTPFPISNNVTRLASLLIRAELKDFSLNMIFLANYVQSDDFCFFSSRKRRKPSLPFLCLRHSRLEAAPTITTVIATIASKYSFERARNWTTCAKCKTVYRSGTIQ